MVYHIIKYLHRCFRRTFNYTDIQTIGIHPKIGI